MALFVFVVNAAHQNKYSVCLATSATCSKAAEDPKQSTVAPTRAAKLAVGYGCRVGSVIITVKPLHILGGTLHVPAVPSRFLYMFTWMLLRCRNTKRDQPSVVAVLSMCKKPIAKHNEKRNISFLRLSLAYL